MTFRGSFERDVRDFTEQDAEMKKAVEEEDDDTVEIVVNERFFHRPVMFYSQDKLVSILRSPSPDASVYLQRRREEAPANQGRDHCRCRRLHSRQVQSSLQRAEMARCDNATSRRGSGSPKEVHVWGYDHLHLLPVQPTWGHCRPCPVRGP